MIKVAFIGRMRSGKSTASDHLLFKDFKRFHSLSLGNAIKDISDEYFSHLYERKVVGTYPFDTIEVVKPRKILQHIGQSFREIDEDIWIKQIENRIKYLDNLKDFRGVIIDDIRQPNEYEWAKENGFVIIKIDTSVDTIKKRMESLNEVVDDSFNHDTESHINDFDYDYVISGETNSSICNNLDKLYNEGKLEGKTEGWTFIE